MNIRTNYINDIQQQEETKKPSKSLQNEGTFEALFSQEMNSMMSTSNTNAIVLTKQPTINDTNIVMALNNTESINSIKNDELLSLSEQTDNLLLSWDNYSTALEKGVSIHDAWDMISSIENQVTSLQGNLAKTESSNQELDSIANELSIMTTVEKIKINRGDYM